MTALYPRFLRAATRISASSWRETAATWTIEGGPEAAAGAGADVAGVVAAGVAAANVGAGVEVGAGLGVTGAAVAVAATPGVGLRGAETGFSSD